MITEIIALDAAKNRFGGPDKLRAVACIHEIDPLTRVATVSGISDREFYYRITVEIDSETWEIVHEMMIGN